MFSWELCCSCKIRIYWFSRSETPDTFVKQLTFNQVFVLSLVKELKSRLTLYLCNNSMLVLLHRKQEADRTASQQTLVITNCCLIAYCTALPMKLHAVTSTHSRWLSHHFQKLFRPSLYLAVPSDIPSDQYFEHVTANSIFILFLQISLPRVVIKWS